MDYGPRRERRRHPASKVALALIGPPLLFAGFACYQLMRQTTAGVHVQLVSADLLHVLGHSTSHASESGPEADADADADADCPFRYLSLHRSIYVYPTPLEIQAGLYNRSILSDHSPPLEMWPWLSIDEKSRATGAVHYNVNSWTGQYSLELIVREIMTHPKSCLRTDDPDNAALFYVPYLSSTHHHNGRDFPNNHATSPYAQAIIDAINAKYDKWEEVFTLTSKYWKRKGGSDHILVHSEVNQGLLHRPRKRSHYHYIQCQKQLTPPISISIELSKTFVETYPSCAAKNVLVPYPNPDGKWYNGEFDAEAAWERANLGTIAQSAEALPAEKEISKSDGSNSRILLALSSSSSSSSNATTTNGISIMNDARPRAVYYNTGMHGLCVPLREAIDQDLKCTQPSLSAQKEESIWATYALPVRMATFCPCPVGDTPSARRMYDAVIAGCIPIVLSSDFVWPFTDEADISMDAVPADFSIRLNVSDYLRPRHDDKCNVLDRNRVDIRTFIESIPKEEIRRLRRGVRKASYLYSFYSTSGPNAVPKGVDSPLKERILPDGGAAHALINALAKRTNGIRWKACEEELKATPDISETLIEGCK